MTFATVKQAALAAATGTALAVALPATAAEPLPMHAQGWSDYRSDSVFDQLSAEHKRKKRYDDWDDYDDDDHHYGRRDRYYGEPIYRDTRIWRGRDGRYYCRKENGTTGLLIGAGVGGLIGNEVAGRGDKALGTLLGAVGGALLGREIDRSNSRCR
ncbi:MAG: glycine zipper 2TM domain-containing protein [Erythrobacter sp.]